MTDITTEQVRSAFANRAYTDAGVDEFLVQFDRWLNAERARVWDECCAALSDFWNGPDWVPEPTNPYRQGADDD